MKMENEEYNSVGLLCKRQEFGINKRFCAAMAAMQGILSNRLAKDKSIQLIIKESLMCADELLRQENENT